MKQEVFTIWEELGNITTDDDGNIDIPFKHFPSGTDREEIWHWIEDEFDVKVHDLMYGKIRLKSFCKIRQELLDEGLAVPLGDIHILTADLLEYKYDENDVVFIKWKGEWLEGVSTDYDFDILLK